MTGAVAPAALSGRKMLLNLAWRSTAIFVLLTVAYYLLPAGSPLADAGAAWSAVAVALAVLMVGGVIRAQFAGRNRRPRIMVAAEALLTTLYLIIVVFALIYYRLAVSTGQIDGLLTKTDGLYFTVTIMATVGFGDIHATGTAARAVVTGHMLFNAIYIGTALRLLSRRAPATLATPDDPPDARGS